MTDDIINMAVGFLVLLFIIGLIWMIGNFLVGGVMHPLIKGMNPNNAAGHVITGAMYDEKADRLYVGLRWFFYIIIGVIFFWLIMKTLYGKEETSFSAADAYGG